MAPSLLSSGQIGEILSNCGLECASELAHRVQTYLGCLEKWNASMNLTAIRHPVEVLRILLAESFFAAKLVGDPMGSILDIGSGAGFPGLAMAVYRPELRLVLLEPRKKRAAFLGALRRELGLARVDVWSKRLEECAASDFSTPPAALAMRAVGGVTELVERATPLLQGDRRVLLFSSAQNAKSTMENLRKVRWQPQVTIPWYPAHRILLGQATVYVPRETIVVP